MVHMYSMFISYFHTKIIALSGRVHIILVRKNDLQIYMLPLFTNQSIFLFIYLFIYNKITRTLYT